MGFDAPHHQLSFFPSFIAAAGGDEGRKKRNRQGDNRNLGLMPANARGYMLSPLRGWLHAVQYHFLNGHSSCGDSVICRAEQLKFVVLNNSALPTIATPKLTRRVTSEDSQPVRASKSSLTGTRSRYRN